MLLSDSVNRGKSEQFLHRRRSVFETQVGNTVVLAIVKQNLCQGARIVAWPDELP